MFKKNPGPTNFERCQLKRISDVLDSRGSIVSTASRLECAVTGPDGFTAHTDSGQKKLEILTKNAGERLCGSCAFAGMTRAEYIQQRMDDLALEKQLAEEEHRLAMTHLSLQEQLSEERTRIIHRAGELAAEDRGDGEPDRGAGQP